MFKRRRIGAAYELCPAEKLGMWTQRNTLAIVGGGVGAVIWCLLVIFAARILHVITEGSGSDGQPPFDDSGVTGVAIKLIGGFIIFVLVIKRTAK